MTFDAFDALPEPEFLWWVVKVVLALAAFCAGVMAVRWVWARRRGARRRRRIGRRVDRLVERLMDDYR